MGNSIILTSGSKAWAGMGGKVMSKKALYITLDTTKAGDTDEHSFKLPLLTNSIASEYDFDVFYRSALLKHVDNAADCVITIPPELRVGGYNSSSVRVKIVGKLRGFSFGRENGGDKKKIISIGGVDNNDDFRLIMGFEGIASFFYGCENLESVQGVFNLEGCKSVQNFFRECSSLANIDIKFTNTGNVTSMINMFNGCSSLVNIDLSGFDTRNVTSMYQMFFKCEALKSVDVRGFVTSSVVNMANMFGFCLQLVSVDFSGFDISNVADLNGMFFLITSVDNPVQNDIYSAALIYWATLPVQTDIYAGFALMKYAPSAASARSFLINTKGWHITDGGPQ